MWCKNNNCCHYDIKNNKCQRLGEDKVNKDKVGICWMAESEYHMGLSNIGVINKEKF
jgi:hypothetical protein